jgi:hypothetical protein
LTEAIATALIELAEKTVTRLREGACWRLPSFASASWLGGHQRPGTIMLSGARDQIKRQDPPRSERAVSPQAV